MVSSKQNSNGAVDQDVGRASGLQQPWHGVAWFLLGLLTKSMTLDAALRFARQSRASGTRLATKPLLGCLCPSS